MFLFEQHKLDFVVLKDWHVHMCVQNQLTEKKPIYFEKEQGGECGKVW